MDNNKKKELKELFYYFGLVTQVGLAACASILVSILAGYYIDKSLHTKPLFTLISIFIGIGAAFYTGYKLLTKKPKIE
jgi:F0F1-type ATP synthase assembly protein I